jgi:hypothetical protein
VIALTLLLVPGFLFALFPNGAPPLVARMLVWANTITLLGLFASIAAAAISVAGSVAVHLLLRFRQATKVSYEIIITIIRLRWFTRFGLLTEEPLAGTLQTPPSAATWV